MGLDKQVKRTIIQKANELSDINVSDGQAYALAYKAMYDSEEFNCGECFIISRLVDLYTAIKEGLIDKAEGKERQNAILNVMELE